MFIKKRKIWFIGLLIILSCFFVINKPIFADSQESIRELYSTVIVNQDSTIEVEESITYDFGLNKKHGIIRYIPYKYQLEDKILVLDYEVKSVQDNQGENIKYSLYTEGNNFVIKIGSENLLISNEKTYVINYVIGGAINYFSDYDELFWNVTGNNWQVPINHAQLDLVLNNTFTNLSLEDFKAICYTGALGVKKENCQINKSSLNRVISFNAYNIKIKEGLTAVIGWPKGFVKEVNKEYILKNNTYSESALVRIWSIFRYIFFLFPLIVFVILFSIWWKIGRNPRRMRVIMAEYEAPASISPAEAHVIVTEGAVNIGKMTTSTLIDLARRGYLIIKEQSKKILVFQSKDWKFIRTNKQNSDDVINKYEKYILDTIFKDGDEVLLSGLKRVSSITEFKKLQKNLEAAISSLGKSLIDKNLIPQNPFSLAKKITKWKLGLLIFYVLITFLLVFAIRNFDWGLGFIPIGFILTMIIFSVFIRIMPSLTDKGMEMKEKLKGFELFLKTVERDRVKFHFSPEAHPEKFADYLPYAILFGVEKQWAKLFTNISIATPQWYQSKEGANISSIYMSSNMLNINLGISSSSFVTGFSAANGGSGFGGGGFSGGGFGGGGGGSW
jgi:uncharacterized membrane protein